MKAFHGALALAVAMVLAGCGAPATTQPAVTAPAPTGDNMLPVGDGNAAPVPLPNDQVSADQSAAIGHDATTSTQRADDSDGIGLGGGGGTAAEDDSDDDDDNGDDDDGDDDDASDDWVAEDGDIGDGEDLTDAELDARG